FGVGIVDEAGFGAVKIVGAYPIHWRASTHPTGCLDAHIRGHDGPGIFETVIPANAGIQGRKMGSKQA
ncbi:MAG: hypothetical protein GY869_13620, partial [Planctomycetes bacterium]|nr:hypothetical protein [Planctomycetota bacterium]